MTYGAFTIEGHPGHVIGFMAHTPHEYSNNVFHTSNTTASNPCPPPHAGNTIYQIYLLSSIMIEQTTIQAALASIECFDGTKGKFEAWMESIENEVQISGQNAICIAFSKLIGSPLWTANRLKMW